MLSPSICRSFISGTIFAFEKFLAPTNNNDRSDSNRLFFHETCNPFIIRTRNRTFRSSGDNWPSSLPISVISRRTRFRAALDWKQPIVRLEIGSITAGPVSAELSIRLIVRFLFRLITYHNRWYHRVKPTRIILFWSFYPRNSNARRLHDITLRLIFNP